MTYAVTYPEPIVWIVAAGSFAGGMAAVFVLRAIRNFLKQ